MNIKGHKYLKRYFYFTAHLYNRLKILSVLINKCFLSETKTNKQELEGTRDSAYLRQVIFADAPFSKKLSY